MSDAQQCDPPADATAPRACAGQLSTRQLSFLVALVLLVSLLSTPLPAAAADPSRGVVNNPRADGVNLRQLPCKSCPLLDFLPNGTAVTFLGGRANADGYEWLQIEEHGRHGWSVSYALQRTEDVPPPRDLDPYGISRIPILGPIAGPIVAPFLPQPVPQPPPVARADVQLVSATAHDAFSALVVTVVVRNAGDADAFSGGSDPSQPVPSYMTRPPTAGAGWQLSLSCEERGSPENWRWTWGLGTPLPRKGVPRGIDLRLVSLFFDTREVECAVALFEDATLRERHAIGGSVKLHGLRDQNPVQELGDSVPVVAPAFLWLVTGLSVEESRDLDQVVGSALTQLVATGDLLRGLGAGWRIVAEPRRAAELVRSLAAQVRDLYRYGVRYRVRGDRFEVVAPTGNVIAKKTGIQLRGELSEVYGRFVVEDVMGARHLLTHRTTQHGVDDFAISVFGRLGDAGKFVVNETKTHCGPSRKKFNTSDLGKLKDGSRQLIDDSYLRDRAKLITDQQLREDFLAALGAGLVVKVLTIVRCDGPAVEVSEEVRQAANVVFQIGDDRQILEAIGDVPRVDLTQLAALLSRFLQHAKGDNGPPGELPVQTLLPLTEALIGDDQTQLAPATATRPPASPYPMPSLAPLPTLAPPATIAPGGGAPPPQAFPSPAAPMPSPSPSSSAPSAPLSNCLAQSAHPYANTRTDTWTITNPDPRASSTRVHFSRLETESGYDYVDILDASGQQVQRLTGGYSVGLWSNAVTGQTVRIRFTTDSSVVAWGFCVDQVQTVAANIPTTPPPVTTTPALVVTTPPPLGAPTISVTARCSATFPALDLSVSPVGAATGYRFYRDGAYEADIGSGTTEIIGYNAAGRTYTFSARAVRGSEVGPVSNNVTIATPTCSTPPPVVTIPAAQGPTPGPTSTGQRTTNSFGGRVYNATTGAGIGRALVYWGNVSTYTDGSGNYSFSNVPCDTRTLGANATAYVPYAQSYALSCNASVAARDIPLQPTNSFGGRIYNASTGAGIGGALVSWGSSSTFSDSFGNYTLTDVPCDTRTLSASASGYQSYSAGYALSCNASPAPKDIPLSPTVVQPLQVIAPRQGDVFTVRVGDELVILPDVRGGQAPLYHFLGSTWPAQFWVDTRRGEMRFSPDVTYERQDREVGYCVRAGGFAGREQICRTFTVRVLANPGANQPPYIETPIQQGGYNARVNQLYSARITAGDRDGDTLSYRLAETFCVTDTAIADCSPGIVLNERTGQLDWVPQPSFAGASVYVTVTVSDPTHRVLRTFAIDVAP